MKVCVIGCGNQGGCFACLLAMESDITQIVLADADIDTAKQVKKQIEDMGTIIKVKEIITMTVDATDVNGVIQVARGADLVFNGILPFCNIPVMKACLKIRAHYMDLYSLSTINEDAPYQQTIEAQMELDEEFKNKGLTALPCQGVQPGWVNLAAQYIMRDMDIVESLIIRGLTWVDSDELLVQGPEKLTILLNLHLSPSSYLKDGKVIRMDSIDEGEIFEFPQPAGKKKIYIDGLSAVEKIIMMNSDKPIGLIMSKGSILPGTSDVKETIFKAVREQVIKNPEKKDITMIDALASSLKQMANVDFKSAVESGRIRNGAECSSVDITGSKNGRDVHHMLYYITSMEESVNHIPWTGNSAYGTTGGMPIVVALMLLRGQITKRGVITAAQLENPEEIFEELEKRGHYILEKIEKSTRR